MAYFLSPAEWLESMTADFASVGFDEPPQPAGEREANGMTWQLYTTKYIRHPIDLALAEGKQGTLLVLMMSEPRERDVIYQQVFIPMVDGARER